MDDQKDLPVLLRAEEAARLLSVGRSTVYTMLANDELPGVVRIRGCLRISRSALLDWIREQDGSANPHSIYAGR